MRLQRDVVQVMNVKYKGENLECTKCSKSMLVVDILYDYLDGSLEYLTVVDNGKRYNNLDYNGFCNIFYSVFMDLVTYIGVVNYVLKNVYPLKLEMGENITYSDAQKKVVTFDVKTKKVVVSAKTLRMCRDSKLEGIPVNVSYMIGEIYKGVGYLIYDTYFKGKRFGFDNILKGVTQKDIFAQEFANCMMLQTSYLDCNKLVPPRGRNRILLVRALQEQGFKNIY